MLDQFTSQKKNAKSLEEVLKVVASEQEYLGKLYEKQFMFMIELKDLNMKSHNGFFFQRNNGLQKLETVVHYAAENNIKSNSEILHDLKYSDQCVRNHTSKLYDTCKLHHDKIISAQLAKHENPMAFLEGYKKEHPHDMLPMSKIDEHMKKYQLQEQQKMETSEPDNSQQKKLQLHLKMDM